MEAQADRILCSNSFNDDIFYLLADTSFQMDPFLTHPSPLDLPTCSNLSSDNLLLLYGDWSLWYDEMSPSQPVRLESEVAIARQGRARKDAKIVSLEQEQRQLNDENALLRSRIADLKNGAITGLATQNELEKRVEVLNQRLRDAMAALLCS
ncbi:hypothetical protein HDU98_001389 [Podochytrium sp. JEL0797]|nr:hypothetical protein HDU98_001389 [Podochytrium sp. JEL0797]